jgi:hypothetical protein
MSTSDEDEKLESRVRSWDLLGSVRDVDGRTGVVLHPSTTRPSARRQLLARVHDAGGVERVLDRPHQVDRVAVLGADVLQLAQADAVLAGAGAAGGQRERDELGVGGVERARAAASPGSKNSVRWKLPSPTWPMT